MQELSVCTGEHVSCKHAAAMSSKHTFSKGKVQHVSVHSALHKNKYTSKSVRQGQQEKNFAKLIANY